MSYDRPLPLWAQRLIELRRARAWSAADLASELKKQRDDLPSARSLTHMIQMDWETGKHHPDPRYRLLLAAVYQTDEHLIFGDQATSTVLLQEALESCGNAAAESTETFSVGEVTTWITATNTSDAAIEHIERVASSLAQMHTRVPDREVLAAVMQLHRAAQLLLRGGRQRLRQMRELVRLNGPWVIHSFRYQWPGSARLGGRVLGQDAGEIDHDRRPIGRPRLVSTGKSPRATPVAARLTSTGSAE